MNSGEYYDFEDRRYVNPTLSRDEQLSFIDRLREVENKDLQKIATDTHNLGTDVPSNLGGLSGIGAPNSIGISGADTGSAGIWRNRYERPQVNALAQNLKAAAQASALNNILNNLTSQYKNRYNQAQRNYNKAAGGTGSTSGIGDMDPFDTEIGNDNSKYNNIGATGEYNVNDLYIKDANGNVQGVASVVRDTSGNIIGVDEGNYSGSGNSLANRYSGWSYGTEETGLDAFRNKLNNKGYSLYTIDGQKIIL